MENARTEGLEASGPRSPEAVLGLLCRIAAEQADVDAGSVRAGSLLEDDLGMDSLDKVEFSMAIEEALGLELPEEAAASVRTVGDAHRLALAELAREA